MSPTLPWSTAKLQCAQIDVRAASPVYSIQENTVRGQKFQLDSSVRKTHPLSSWIFSVHMLLTSLISNYTSTFTFQSLRNRAWNLQISFIVFYQWLCPLKRAGLSASALLCQSLPCLGPDDIECCVLSATQHHRLPSAFCTWYLLWCWREPSEESNIIPTCRQKVEKLRN